MLADRSQRLLKAAAAETIKRIQQDRKRAPQRIKTLLAHIEQNLFDHALDVNQLKRSCGVRDNSVPIQFHAELGLPPHAYIEDCRLQTACRLLRDSDLKVWQIAELLGYSSIQVFSRAFTRWAGVRPTTFRKEQRRRAAVTGSAVATRPVDAWASKAEEGNGKESAPPPHFEDTLSRALDGTLEAPQAQQLIKKLLSIYPPTSGAETASAAARAKAQGTAFSAIQDDAWTEMRNTIAAKEIEKIKVDVVLNELDKRSWDAKRELVRSHLRLDSPLFFHRLQERSAAALAAGDHGLSYHMAQLALDAADDAIDATRSPEALRAALRAEAWTSIGYARLASGDDGGCDEALRTAERLVATGHVEAQTEAQYLTLLAARCRSLARPALALRHLERAYGLFEADGDDDGLTRTHAALGTAHIQAGASQLGLQHLQTALGRIAAGHTPAFQLALHTELVEACLQSDHLQEADAYLQAALKIETAGGAARLRARLRALEGQQAVLLERPSAAEHALRESLEQLLEIDEPLEAALVCFDLATLYATQARDAARRRLVDTLSTLSAVAQGDEASLQHLRIALAPQALEPERREEARDALEVVVRQHRARHMMG